MQGNEIHDRLAGGFGEEVLAGVDRYGDHETVVRPGRLPEIVAFLRDDPALACDMLVDLVAIDYSRFAGDETPRFGVLYLFKSFPHGHRFRLKTRLEEEEPEVGTISHLYKNADWLEREAWDQMGIRFAGHPNLKRLLNHHEFVGHPLRKDYPITRRQWLTEPDSLMDEMDNLLQRKGWS